jgi:hypothetical protein
VSRLTDLARVFFLDGCRNESSGFQCFFTLRLTLGNAVSKADEGVTLVVTGTTVMHFLNNPLNDLDPDQIFVIKTQKGIGNGDYE